MSREYRKAARLQLVLVSNTCGTPETRLAQCIPRHLCMSSQPATQRSIQPVRLRDQLQDWTSPKAHPRSTQYERTPIDDCTQPGCMLLRSTAFKDMASATTREPCCGGLLTRPYSPAQHNRPSRTSASSLNTMNFSYRSEMPFQR